MKSLGTHPSRLAVAVLAGLFGTGSVALAADTYQVDAAHSAAVFRISHLNLSWTYGRFNDLQGNFTIDTEDPSKTQFLLEANAESIDTGNAQRDTHLRSPDFLNTRQFPKITFKSTKCTPIANGWRVEGELTVHGVTQPATLIFVGGKTAEFPPGTTRTGFSTEFTIRRSAFGMDRMLQAVGDEVQIFISFEGIRQ
ncbi:MAG: UPF0312 protein [Pirellulaceae bacterium]|nr:MAG: UPF0312 protein [Pirellulaceae bacterium]